MIEFIAVALIVSFAALYWYKRLFPASWNRTRLRLGLALNRSPILKAKAATAAPSAVKVAAVIRSVRIVTS